MFQQNGNVYYRLAPPGAMDAQPQLHYRLILREVSDTPRFFARMGNSNLYEAKGSFARKMGTRKKIRFL